MSWTRNYILMATSMPPDSSALHVQLKRAAEGDQQAWAVLLEQHQNRLRRMIALRLDQRLQGRIDPEDVLQETYLEAATHLADYLKQPPMPFFFWLRGIAGNMLLALHRQHLGTKMRDAGREVALYRGSLPEASSAALAAQLLGRDTRPSEAAVRAERKILLQQALNSLEPLDREVLALRHFEQLSNVEVALTLGIQEAAAAKRYVRALKRLKGVLQNMPGGRGGI
jgi:RNA polymerase sigma-70 factor (ECF subfamily)